MLTPKYLGGVAEPMVVLWSQLEDDIISDIAKRLVKSGCASETTSWQIKKAREMGVMQADISKQIQRLTNMSSRKVNKIVREACETSLNNDGAVYIAAGMHPAAFSASPALQEVFLAGVRKTNGLMANFTSTTANTASKAFENSLDRAYMQIMSGAFTPDQAIRRAIDNLAREGMESIAYPSGHIEKLDVAVRRAIVTGTNQTTAELTIARAAELESDLVEVSAHAGARPSHAVWQGRIFSLSGKTKGYGDFYAETGYGTGAGLCGWNCRHSFFPYILGFSTPSFVRDPAREIGKNNDELYEESQRQRAYERAVRESKRECVALDAAVSAAGSDELRASLKIDFQRASVKLKRREATLKEFISTSSQRRDTTREYVNGYDRSVSAKAVWANRRTAG